METAEPKKRKAHLFKKGQSGNPGGRPVGKLPGTLMREALAERLGEANTKQGRERALKAFFDRLLALALDRDDMQAMQMILKRLAPELKSTELAQPLALDPSADPAVMSRQALQALASGEISLDQAVRLTSTISATAGLEQAAEFEERLSRLEELANASK